MKAILQNEAGGIEQCVLGEIDKPAPVAGEILVKVAFAGLNPADYKLMTNGFPGWQWPHVPGLDGAGEIVEIGSAVHDLKVGDKVAFHNSLRAQGTCAEYVSIAAGCAALVPASMDMADAAAVPCAGLTAYQLIHYKLPQLNESHSALVHAGAGGVGGYAIQLLARLGVSVLTTCSPGNNDYCKLLGAKHCIDYNGLDEAQLTEKVLSLTDGRGVDVAINSINRDSATADMQRLAFSGHLCFVAGQPHFDQFKAFSKAMSFHEAALGAAHLTDNQAAIADIGKMLGELLALVASGGVKLLKQEQVGIDGVIDAFQRLSERHVCGKIVAQIGLQ